ncbi:MAG: alpha/beta hydrolase [Nitrospirota bacterium]
MQKAFPIIIFCLFCFSSLGCSSLLFYPRTQLINNPALNELHYENIYFKTSDGLSLHGWFIKAKDKHYGTILYLHGNAENISTQVYNVLWFATAGYNIFAFDYRGYGKSEGTPSLEGVHTDAAAALETIFSLAGMEQERIFVYGQSLGGAIAIYTLATSSYKSSIKGLIVDSSFSDYRLIVKEKLADFILTWPLQYPLSLLFNNYYSPVKWISSVSPLPVLLIYGDKDTIVPVHHGLYLYNSAFKPKEIWLITDAGHIQGLHREETRKRMLEYLMSFDHHF